MSQPLPHARSPLFLREEELRDGIDLLYFAARDLGTEAARLMEAQGLGRSHYRVLYFVCRRPGITLVELQTIMRTSKQSVSRLLKRLVEGGLILRRTGDRDRRQRPLEPSERGRAVVDEVGRIEMQRLAAVYREVGPEAVGAFHRVLLRLIDERTRAAIAATE